MANRLFDKRGSTRLWGNSTSDTYGEIDMRAEMKEILHGSSSKPQRGHWVVYREFHLDITASGFYDEVYREGVDGPAHEYTDHIVITRRDPVYAPEKGEAETAMGQLIGAKNIYYFEHDFVPRPYDQIFEFTWADHRVTPTFNDIAEPYNDKFNIKEVYPFRCDSGRIEYWVAMVNKDRVNY